MLGRRLQLGGAAVAAWSAFGLTFAAGVAFVVFGFLSQGVALPSDLASTTDGPANVANALLFVVLAASGALIASRRPSSTIGWILCLAPIALSWTTLAESVYVYTRYAHPGALPFNDNLLWAANWIWSLGFVPLFTWLLLLFPDGHLLSPRWRLVSWLAALSLGMLVLGYAFSPGPLEDYGVLVNPFGVSGPVGDVLRALRSAALPVLLFSAVLSTASLVIRYRGARAQERQQLKWVAVAGAVALIGWISGAASGVGTLVSLSLLAFPVAVVIAVLRYRLYDIDVVINRTLVYGSLTATLGAFYVGSILLLELLLQPVTSESDLAIAASTLAAAALFRPLRSRIQEEVDRRFYRRRYDARRTLDAFAATLRREIDLDALRAELTGVVGETMRPAHVSLWLRDQDGASAAVTPQREAGEVAAAR